MKGAMEMAERAASGDTAPDVIEWIRESCSAYLGGRDLACAFGLDQHARKREARRLILEVAKLLDDGQCSRWELALRVEQCIARFESVVWPRVRAGRNDLTAPTDELLYRLLRCRTRFPKEQRQIFDVATRHLELKK